MRLILGPDAVADAIYGILNYPSLAGHLKQTA
jgi:hypothetical protein